jgi:hypothetical protein
MAETTTARQNAALDAVAEALRADARSFAAQLRALAELADAAQAEEREGGLRQFPMLELAGTARLGAASSSRRLAEADRVVTTLPITLRLLGEGELLVHQARVMIAETAACDPEVARRAEAVVLPESAGWCPADLRKAVRRAVVRLESELSAERGQDLAAQRLADARAGRRTWTTPDTDGMGVASALLPAEQLRRWQLDLDQLERAERVADRAAGIERTSDQRRADLFAALPGMLLDAQRGGSVSAGGSAAPPARTVLNVLVPVATVLDVSREPGTVEGVGPISAEHVRLLRPSGLRRVLVAQETGQPLAVDDRPTPAEPDPIAMRRQVLAMLRPDVIKDTAEPQHDPSAALARLVDLRDLHCAGPGCSEPRGDRDHLRPWPDGPTAAWNLHRLSERCHAAKHAGWTMVRHPDGSTTWHSPLTRTYERPPPHPKPPKIDPDTDLPPLRLPPTGAPPWTLDEAWTPPEPEPTDAVGEPAADGCDEPPF